MSLLWTSEALVAAMDGRPLGPMPEGISGISIDSRSLEPGDAFFAIKGEAMDGHDFATAAIKAGAGVLVVAEGKLPSLGRLTAPIIVVEDVLVALEKLGVASRTRSQAKIIAVTGSAGKTTTTTLVGRIAQSGSSGKYGRVWIGGNIGDPLINYVDEMQPSDLAILEISSFQAELMTSSPNVASILNVTPNHLDRHGTMDAYTAAKARSAVERMVQIGSPSVGGE